MKYTDDDFISLYNLFFYNVQPDQLTENHIDQILEKRKIDINKSPIDYISEKELSFYRIPLFFNYLKNIIHTDEYKKFCEFYELS